MKRKRDSIRRPGRQERDQTEQILAQVDPMIKKFAGKLTQQHIVGALASLTFDEAVAECRLFALDAIRTYKVIPGGCSITSHIYNALQHKCAGFIYRSPNRIVRFPAAYAEGRLKGEPVAAMVCASLSEPSSGDQDGTSAEHAWNLATTPDHAGRILDRLVLAQVLRHLDPRDRAILLATFEGDTYEECGKRWNLSRERIRQIRQSALERSRRIAERMVTL